MNRAEIRLYDPARRPAHWTEILTATDCAVFLRGRSSAAPHHADGSACGDPLAATCVVFATLDEAERFARERVSAFPHLCADIFDAEGRANPPLVTIEGDAGASRAKAATASRWRRAIALALVVLAGPLIWLDWTHGLSLIFPMFLALGCLAAAARLLHWDLGARADQRLREQRLDDYRRRVPHV